MGRGDNRSTPKMRQRKALRKLKARIKRRMEEGGLPKRSLKSPQK